MRTAKRSLGLISLFVAVTGFSDVMRYPSGKWRSFELNELTDQSGGAVGRASERAAFSRFLKNNFPEVPGAEWKPVNQVTDYGHTHALYQLHLEGIPVDTLFTKLHYSHSGYVSYATSAWEIPWEKNIARFHRTFDEKPAEAFVRKSFNRRYRGFRGPLESTKIWWVDKKNEELVPAFKFTVNWWEKKLSQEWIVAADLPRLLEQRDLVRHATVNNVSVYEVSPLGMGATFDTVDIPDLTAATALSNSFVHVYREENTANGGDPTSIFDVDPQNTYTGGEFSLDPRAAFYRGLTCVTCDNQKFDAVNAYYHLNGYRQYVSGLHSTLGLTSTVGGLLADPLAVFINSLSTDFDGSGDGSDDTDNAAYFSSTCRSGYATTFPRCLALLRTSVVSTSSCTGSLANITIYHLAREANVVVHEFQHYITDRVTGLIAGTYSKPRVGDALHEGYSDYFGASSVTRVSGSDASTIGAYAFQNCSPIVRNISTLQPFENSEEDEDPHYSGITWASGLWSLRESFGATYADQLALQSQFFIPPTAGFIDSVEALVQADKVITSGARAATIRTLYYSTLKWNGGDASIFRDPATGVADVGFRSCGGVSLRKASLPFSILFFSFWFGGLLWLGRRFSRR